MSAGRKKSSSTKAPAPGAKAEPVDTGRWATSPRDNRPRIVARISWQDEMRVRQFAMEESVAIEQRVTVQDVILYAVSRLLVERGWPPLDAVKELPAIGTVKTPPRRR